MTTKDTVGYTLSGGNAHALDLLEQALHQFRCFADNPLATAEAALAEAPDLVMAQVLRAWLYLLSSEAAGVAPAREALAAARELPGPATFQRQRRAAVADAVFVRPSDARKARVPVVGHRLARRHGVNIVYPFGFADFSGQIARQLGAAGRKSRDIGECQLVEFRCAERPFRSVGVSAMLGHMPCLCHSRA